MSGVAVVPYSGKWLECPSRVIDRRKYALDEENDRIAVFVGGGEQNPCDHTDYYCTVIADTPLAPAATTAWSVRLARTLNSGFGVYVGVAPMDLDLNAVAPNCHHCGWYFYCYESTLFSGPPQRFRSHSYRHGDEKKKLSQDDVVGVVMDTEKGSLAFSVNGQDYGTAFEGIPLDKPLVPTAVLFFEYDSVELVKN